MITLGDIDCEAIVFEQGHPDNPVRYIVGRDDWTMGQLWERYGHNVHKATGVGLDDPDRNFYLVFVADCFDPPKAIVRADNPAEAEEKFVDELNWAHIHQEDLPDYEDSDALSFGPSGEAYDSEAVKMVDLGERPVVCMTMPRK